MTYAGREAFFSLQERRYKDEDFPKIGKVRLQSLTAAEHRSVTDPDKERDWLLGRFIAATVIDENGHPIFGDMDVERLSQMDYAPSQIILEKIADHCGIQSMEVDEDAQRDELKKS